MRVYVYGSVFIARARVNLSQRVHCTFACVSITACTLRVRVCDYHRVFIARARVYISQRVHCACAGYLSQRVHCACECVCLSQRVH
jgi:hypothetical protein